MTREQAYLQVVEGWLRDNRGIVFTEGAVDDLCDRIAAAIGRLGNELLAVHKLLTKWSDANKELEVRVTTLEGMLGEANIAVPE